MPKAKAKVDKVESTEITTVKGTTRTFVKLPGNNLYYEFNNGRQLEVYNPAYLNTDKGCHRIICSDGTCLFIDPINGWFMSWNNFNAIDENYRF